MANPTIVDLSRQRSSSGTEDTAKTTAAAENAAAEVEGILGDGLTDADKQAVAIGTRLALLQYSTVWSLQLGDAGHKFIGAAMKDLEKLATRRALEVDWSATDHDYANLDKRFPARAWDGDDDSDGLADDE